MNPHNSMILFNLLNIMLSCFINQFTEFWLPSGCHLSITIFALFHDYQSNSHSIPASPTSLKKSIQPSIQKKSGYPTSKISSSKISSSKISSSYKSYIQETISSYSNMNSSNSKHTILTRSRSNLEQNKKLISNKKIPETGK